MLASPRMTTVQLSRPGSAEAGRDVDAPTGGSSLRFGRALSRAPSALIAGLLLVVLYAAFAHGASSDPAEARVQIGLSVVAALAGIPLFWHGTLRLRAHRAGAAGAMLLAAFAAWNGLTLLWSVAPNQTWLELNRELAYVLVLVLAIVAGASHRRPLQTIATGYLLVALVITAYALGQKIAPGIDIPGLIDLNQTATFARLQAPFDYWNALALFVVLAVPVALVIARDGERSPRSRMGALLAVELMLLVIGLTYSRGGLIALVVVLAVSLVLGGERLKTLALLLAAAVAMVPPLLVALLVSSLSGAKIPLSDREVGGGEFLLVLLASLAVLYFVGRRLLPRELRVELVAEQRHRARRLALAGVGVAVVIILIAVSLSSRGLTGTISHTWHDFTTPHASTNVNVPNATVSSSNRWVWWKDAFGAWTARPLGGWGAGSFGVVDPLYTISAGLTAEDVHSAPLQWLAETGLVGALLAFTAFGLLLAAGVRATRRKSGLERAFAAALVAAAVAYALHALYDWDWEMPGVTFPVLLFLGAVAGSAARRRTWPTAPRDLAARGLALAACTCVMCVYAISALLPALAASKASAAVTQAGATSSRARLLDALSTAELASRLDPLSDAGQTAAASIAAALGQPALARSYLLEAVRRDPSDVLAWEQLADLELGLRDVRAGRQVVTRVLALDPRGTRGPRARLLALNLHELITPPGDSATATSTPLPVH